MSVSLILPGHRSQRRRHPSPTPNGEFDKFPYYNTCSVAGLRWPSFAADRPVCKRRTTTCVLFLKSGLRFWNVSIARASSISTTILGTNKRLKADIPAESRGTTDITARKRATMTKVRL
ncbi:uncharacterized protein UDID_18468 [Ustilago sp. UG-2017a]|nr:uncharacterized protein UDID_18468 [Ustilago sp. UG-2017a]